MSKKKIGEYIKLYGNIPTEDENRILYILNELKFKSSEYSFLDKMYNKFHNSETESFRFILYLVPEPSPRPRLFKRTNTFYVKGAQSNHQLFTEILDSIEELPVITTPTEVNLVSYLPTPKSMNRFEKFFAELGYIHAISTPDWDNLAKTYCDMIQNNLIINDSIIWKGTSTKFYSIKPRIDLEIKFSKSYDCSYNRKKIESSKAYMSEIKERFDSSLNTILKLGGD